MLRSLFKEICTSNSQVQIKVFRSDISLETSVSKSDGQFVSSINSVNVYNIF